MPEMIHLHDASPDNAFEPPPGCSKGLIPRDYSTHPKGCYSSIPIASIRPLTDDEIVAAIKRKDAEKSWLTDLRDVGNLGKPVPSRDQNGRGYCFPAGTKIRMADGTQKNIEDVKVLDKVLSAEGNVRRVMQCHVREHEGHMVTVRSQGHCHLKLTPNHSILTKRGYVPADGLVYGDWISMPKYAPETVKVVQTADHVRKLVRRRIKNVAGKAVWEDREPKDTDTSYNDIPDFIELNERTGRIFGLWLAEGWAYGGCCQWAFNVTETDTLAAELVTLIREEWGDEVTIKPGPGPNVTLVTLTGKFWAKLFPALLGKLAHGKKVCSDLMSGPRVFLEALFWGWMAGDGNITGRRNAYRGCSVSHDLAMNMYDIANFLGLNPAIQKWKGRVKLGGGVKSRRDSWHLYVQKNPGTWRPNYRLISEERRNWRMVTGIERSAFKGTVFNIGVEVDNSYVAEAVGVHNCWAHSSVSAFLLCRARDGQPYADLSAYAVACIIKNYRDEGGWGAESADFIAKRGVPTSEFWPQQSVNSSHDNPQTWANAAFNEITAKFNDIQRNDWRMAATYLIQDTPVVFDIDAWSHSVCGCRVKQWLPRPIFTIWNSWGSWSDNGMGDVSGSYLPNDMVAIDIVKASAV